MKKRVQLEKPAGQNEIKPAQSKTHPAFIECSLVDKQIRHNEKSEKNHELSKTRNENRVTFETRAIAEFEQWNVFSNVILIELKNGDKKLKFYTFSFI